jgi:serine/threonine protein kinase
MNIIHLDSPRIDLTNQINEASNKLETMARWMDHLAVSSSILSSTTNMNLAIVSDIVRLQLKCIARFHEKKMSLEELKKLCTRKVEKMSMRYWNHLTQITEGKIGNQEAFMQKWKEKAIEHVILPKVTSEKEVKEFEHVLQQKLNKLPMKERLHVDFLSDEAAVRNKYRELQSEKTRLMSAIKTQDVFTAAQCGDLVYLEQKKPNPTLGIGRQKKVTAFVNQKDNRENGQRFALLHIAAYAGRLEVVKFLIGNGADIEIRDSFGDRPLHWAAAIGAYEVAALLLGCKADPNARGKRDMGPLHRAVYNGHHALTNLLLDHGADVNLQDSHGVTPIREAIGKNDFYMVRNLLRYARTLITQKDLEIAEGNRHPGIIDLLRTRLGKPKIGMEEIGRIREGDVALEPNPIGGGSFAEVYKGLWNGKIVAVKILRNQADPASETGKYIREEMEAEALVMSQLRHDNVLACHGMLDGRFGFIVDYIPNGNLYDNIVTTVKATWNWDQILTFSKQITQGLAYLHSKKIVHRDFKSSNILIGEQNKAVIADFGLSKVRKFEMTITKGVGSPVWMAPEQFTTKAYSFPIDVYALGMVLWELIETKRPFANLNDVWQVIQRITLQKAGEDIDLRRVPKALARIMESCWKDADHRSTAEEVLDALRMIEPKDLEGFVRPDNPEVLPPEVPAPRQPSSAFEATSRGFYDRPTFVGKKRNKLYEVFTAISSDEALRLNPLTWNPVPTDFSEGRVPFKLGEGRYANTYAGRDTETNEIYAIKEVQGRDKVTQSLQEGETVDSLGNYPHIMPLIDYIHFEPQNERDVPRLFQVMPLAYINGEILKEMLKILNHSEREKVVTDTFWQMMKGLHYIHRNGVFHLDIKADNTLYMKDGTLRIADFGKAARAGDDDQIADINHTGAIAKFSPEIMAFCRRVKHVDGEQLPSFSGKAADVWAAGLYAWELLEFKNERLFSCQSEPYLQRLEKYTFDYFKESVKQIDALSQDVSPSFLDLLRQVLAVDPAERLGTQQVLDALRPSKMDKEARRQTFEKLAGGFQGGALPNLYIYHVDDPNQHVNHEPQAPKVAIPDDHPYGN